jgi:hypothetical protein
VINIDRRSCHSAKIEFELNLPSEHQVTKQYTRKKDPVMTQAMFNSFFSMKTMFRVGVAALSLGLGVANAASFGRPDSTTRSGPYDNTANSPRGGGAFGGDGTGG